MKTLDLLGPLLEGASTLRIIQKVQDTSREAREKVSRLVSYLINCFGEGVPGTVIGTSDGGAVGSLTLSGDLKVSISASGSRITVQAGEESKSFSTEDLGWEEEACNFLKGVLEEQAKLARAEDLLYLEASKLDPGRFSPYLKANTGVTKDRFLFLTDRFGNLRVEAFVKCPPAIRIVAKKPDYKKFFLDLLGNDFSVDDRGEELLVSACDTETGLVSAEKLREFVSRLSARLEELANLVKKNDLAYRY